MIRRHFEFYKMLLKLFTFIFLVHSIPVSDGCADISFSNSSYNFYVQESFNFSLSINQVSSPFTLVFRPSWDRLKFKQNNISITENVEISVEIYAEMQYVYQVEAICVQNSKPDTILDITSMIVAKSEEESSVQRNFGICMGVFVTLIMFALGTDLDYNIILNYLKRPIGPAIGICAQFIGMPVMSYLIGYILIRDQEFARFGLLLIGCSPGGTASNFWTAFFKGDLNLSVTMTFCSSVASFGMSTLWIWALGSQILSADSNLAGNIPYDRIFIAILSLVVPICLGMLFKHKKPELASKVRRISRPLFLLFVIVSVSVSVWINRSFFSLVAAEHVWCGILLSISGFTIGALASYFGGLNKQQIIAVSIETAVQNPSAAFLVMQTTIHSPYSDIGSVPVICYMGFAIGPPMMVALIIFKTVEFIRNKRNGDGNEDTDLKKIEDGDTKQHQHQHQHQLDQAEPKKGGDPMEKLGDKKPNSYGASENKGFEN